MDDRLKTFYELFDRRRSVREFMDRPIEPDKLSRLIVTLRRAQSAANRQPWHFIVVEKKDRLELDTVFTKDCFKAAPIIIAACAEPGHAWVRKADGACWIAAIDPVRVKEILGIPAHIEVVALIAVGYPARELVREEKPRKPLKEIIHYGRWQGE
ncbi:MAG: nitroreductase family protein [Deltaproteobacteria bacterium]|nr:nitroreductase family protein [Deltaproteobacteria bacterium]